LVKNFLIFIVHTRIQDVLTMADDVAMQSTTPVWRTLMMMTKMTQVCLCTTPCHTSAAKYYSPASSTPSSLPSVDSNSV